MLLSLASDFAAATRSVAAKTPPAAPKNICKRDVCQGQLWLFCYEEVKYMCNFSKTEKID